MWSPQDPPAQSSTVILNKTDKTSWKVWLISVLTLARTVQFVVIWNEQANAGLYKEQLKDLTETSVQH